MNNNSFFFLIQESIQDRNMEYAIVNEYDTLLQDLTHSRRGQVSCAFWCRGRLHAVKESLVYLPSTCLLCMPHPSMCLDVKRDCLAILFIAVNGQAA